MVKLMSIRRSRKAQRSLQQIRNAVFGGPAARRFGRHATTLECLESRRLMAVDTSGSSSAFLSIYVDGAKVTIPANVGVSANDTTAETFTTDNSGKIFFAPGNTVTLDDFFDTWRTDGRLAGNRDDAILSSTQLFSNLVDRDSTIQLFVNGHLSTSFEQEQIENGDHIVLVYGSNTVLSLNTNFGSIVVELFDSQKPITVTNFLNYVNDGDYINSFFHRSADSGGHDFVIQGGGFKTSSPTFTSTSQFSQVPTDPPIQNEPGISNLRGTIAMAKTSDPNSATSQFFVNLHDSNSSLDDPNNSGGFTVFGQVLDMTTADLISHFTNRNQGSPFGELPVGPSDQLAVIESIEGQGEVSGFKFNDLDADGVRDANEPGINNVTVWVDSDNNGSLDSGELSTTTAVDGFYEFHLDPGTYVIRALVSAGSTATSNAFSATVEIGGTLTANFGEASPSVINDAYTVNEDGVLNVNAATGVLANDTNSGGGTPTATKVSDPGHGTVNLNSDGSFTYTPNANFFGTDSFSYFASDADSRSITATVTITVAAQPDAPTANNDTFTAPQNNGGVQTIDVLANDSSNPDAAQTLTIVSVTQGSAGGTVSINGSSINYTPAVGFAGSETFTYTIKDTDDLTATATVTVSTVDTSTNNSISGVVYLDKNKNGTRDTGESGLPGSLLTLTGTDNLGASVKRTAITDNLGAYTFSNLTAGTYQIVQQQPGATKDGQEGTTVPGTAVTDDKIANIVIGGNGTFAGNNFAEKYIQPHVVSIAWFFTTAPSQQTLVREAVAKGEEKAGNTSLAAAIRNNATELPPQAVADAYTIAKNGTLTVNAANGVLKNDTNPDNSPFTAAIVSNPSNGTLTLNSDGSFTYKPNTGFVGTDSFTYKAVDGASSSNATVTLTVNNSNVAPQATNNSYTVVEDNTLTVNATNGVLTNDTDADGHTLTAAVVAGPTNGTLTLNTDGSFSYVPNANFVGSDSFTYKANDGTASSNTATVTITVSAVNDPHSAQADTYSIAENNTLSEPAANGVLKNDTNPDNDSLDLSVTTNPTNGTVTLNDDGSFVYTPNNNFAGTDSFVYQASDGNTTVSATVTINVSEGNDRPVANADSYTVNEDTTLTVTDSNNVLLNDTDADGTTLQANVLTNPTDGVLTFSANGTFTYVPNANFSGSDSFTYRATDGEFSSTATVTITVTPVPQALDDAYSTAENVDLTVPVATGVRANDSDIDGDSLTITVVNNPTHGTLTLASDGSFTYEPDSNFVGTDSFTYQASDSNESDTATVTITVTEGNDRPAAVNDNYIATAGQALTINAADGVLDNDTDADGDTLTAERVGVETPENGTLVFNNDGSFTYTPDTGFTGTDTFTYRAKDASLTSTDATVTIVVNPSASLTSSGFAADEEQEPNSDVAGDLLASEESDAHSDAPMASNDTYQVAADGVLVIDVASGILANDLAQHGNAIHASLVSSTLNGSLVLSADGSFEYRPNSGFVGRDSFQYEATDGTLASLIAEVNIDVQASDEELFAGLVDEALEEDADWLLV